MCLMISLFSPAFHESGVAVTCKLYVVITLLSSVCHLECVDLIGVHDDHLLPTCRSCIQVSGTELRKVHMMIIN